MAELTNFKTNEQLLEKVHYDMPYDILIDGRKYYVSLYPDVVHNYTATKRNCYWAWPRDEERSVDNIIPYDGYLGAQWSFTFDQSNYWNGEYMEKCVDVYIIRNLNVFDRSIYRLQNDNLQYAIADTLTRIQRYKDLPCNIDHINYENNLINRNIYYKGIPSIITSYLEGDGCIIIKLLDGEVRAPHYIANNMGLPDEEDSELKVELLDTNIDWFGDVK